MVTFYYISYEQHHLSQFHGENKLPGISKLKISQRLEKTLEDYESLDVLRYENYQTLLVHNANKQYHVETDKDFIADVEKIAKIRRNIIFNIFDKKQRLTDNDCDEIDFKARVHQDASIVNTNTNKAFEELELKDKCECGCKRGTGQNLPICTDEQRLNVLGPGVILMFLFKRATVANLIMVILIYGIFALATNLLGSNIENLPDDCDSGDSYCEFKRKASNEEKINQNYTELVQLWLGFAFCIIWIVTLRFIKYLGRQKNRLVDERLKSASDFAIKIENLPYGSYSQIELIDYFEGLWDKMKEEQAEERGTKHEVNPYELDDVNEGNHFKMKRILIIYNMEFSRQIIEQIFFLSYIVDSYLEKVDGENARQFVKKVEDYKSQKAKLKQLYELLIDLRKKFLNDSEFRKSISTTCCLIEFKDQKKKQQLLEYFGIEKVGIVKQIQSKIKNLFNPESKNIVFKGNVIKIERAPEPSDVLWQNCEKTYSLKRILLIYTVTFLIIAVSFGIITGLEFVQNFIADDDSYNNEDKTLINYATSFGLLIINKVLWFSLFYLLEIEYNHTITQKIISQMNKVLLATCINIIVLPIITNYILTNKLYRVDGLAGFVFDYHISVIAGLAIKLFDPMYIIKKLVTEIKCIRNLFIRWTCNKLPDLNPEKGANEVNKFYEGTYFDIAESYVYMIGAIMHAAFFCHLQPFIVILVTIMVLVFYFINKFKILRYCRIPEMTELLVFETAISQAGLVPILYGVGSISISYMEYTLDNTLPINYVPSAIAIGIGLFGIFNPGDILNKIVRKIMEWFECISVERLVGDESEENFQGDNPTNQVAETLEEGDKATTNRIEVYSENSNALALLGFERILRGEEEKTLLKEYEHFGESFFPQDKLVKRADGLNLVGERLMHHQNQNILTFAKGPAERRKQSEEHLMKPMVKEESD